MEAILRNYNNLYWYNTEYKKHICKGTVHIRTIWAGLVKIQVNDDKIKKEFRQTVLRPKRLENIRTNKLVQFRVNRNIIWSAK